METAMEIMEEALMVPVPVQLPAEECILLQKIPQEHGTETIKAGGLSILMEHGLLENGNSWFGIM